MLTPISCSRRWLPTATCCTCPRLFFPRSRRRYARGAGDPDLAREAVSLYRRWPGVRIAPVDEALGNLAAEVAAEYRIRGCDAVYVALAYAEQAVLITLDHQQRERTPSSVPARTPAQALAEWSQP